MEGVEVPTNYDQRKLNLFFALTFAISWSVWILAPFISFGDLLLLNGICVIGAFGPSISAVIITSKNGTKSHNDNNLRKKRTILFIIVSIISFLSALVMLFFNQFFSFITIFVLFFASIIAAFLISGMYSSNPDIADLLTPIKGVKGKNLYLLVAFSIPILISLGGYLIFFMLGEVIPAEINLFIILLYLTSLFPYIFFFGGALNEEIGWRGFANPYLQEKYSPLMTGIIIGIIWSVWHAPLHFNEFYGDGLFGFLTRFAYNIPFGILFTWYYDKSEKNLLGAIILHASINIYFFFGSIFIEVFIFSMLISFLFLLFIIIHGKMWRK